MWSVKRTPKKSFGGALLFSTIDLQENLTSVLNQLIAVHWFWTETLAATTRRNGHNKLPQKSAYMRESFRWGYVTFIKWGICEGLMNREAG